MSDFNPPSLTETEYAKLRDEFAGQAMQSLILHPRFAETSEVRIAGLAYQQADAMLKRREATK